MEFLILYSNDVELFKILEPIKSLELKNALATYSYIIAHALKIALSKLAIQPQIIFVCGGGRKNFGLMSSLQNQFKNIEFKSSNRINDNKMKVEMEMNSNFSDKNIILQTLDLIDYLN